LDFRGVKKSYRGWEEKSSTKVQYKKFKEIKSQKDGPYPYLCEV
jgi:hypothetical protein